MASKRVSFSIPEDQLAGLDLVCSRMGYSRSALVSMLLSQAVPPLVALAELLPAFDSGLSESDAKRFRGESRQLLRDQLIELQKLGVQHDLFE